MISFTTGCVMAGKTKNMIALIDNYNKDEYLLVVPKLIYIISSILVRSRNPGSNEYYPDLRVDETTDIYSFVSECKQRLPKLQIIFCDEIQFFSKSQIDQLFNINKNLNLQVECYGISNNHRNEKWPTIEYLESMPVNITVLDVKCNYCDSLATCNIRTDYDTTCRLIDVNDGSTEKYYPCCQRCYNLKTNT